MAGTRDAYFWATHAGAELDLLLFLHGKRLGFEFKYADAPRLTKSLRIAMNDLYLDHAYVVYPGADDYSLDDRVDVLSIAGCHEIFETTAGTET